MPSLGDLGYSLITSTWSLAGQDFSQFVHGSRQGEGF